MRHLYTAGSVRTSSGVIGQSLLVEDGLIAAVGTRDDLLGSAPETVIQDGVIVPGLRDAHIHPVAYAAALRGTTLATARDFDEVVSRLAAAAAAAPGDSHVLGMRLNEEALNERRLPTREVLDRAEPNRPILVNRYCGHVAIANSEAMRVAGVDATTPDPVGGVIDRDADGTPTGVLRETAIELVAESLGGSNEISPEELLDALQRLAAVGITSIGAILRSGAGAWASLGNEVDIALAASDRLPIKVGAYIIEESPEQVGQTKQRFDEVADRLRWLGIKRFGDGSFGGHTAAMHDDYIDVPTIGTMRLAAIDQEITEASIAIGGAAAIHAIGDSACGAVIDMFERLVANGADPRKLRIEHASVLTAADLNRLARLGAIAAVQPPFLGSEANWLGKRLGDDRLRRTYAFAAMDAAGIPLAGSSDSPVESPNPWEGMALARDRAGMVPEESMAADRALALYTDGAAFALEEPPPLRVGSPADFVIVDRDPVSSTPDELRETYVIGTYVDGVEVRVEENQPLWLD